MESKDQQLKQNQRFAKIYAIILINFLFSA